MKERPFEIHPPPLCIIKKYSSKYVCLFVFNLFSANRLNQTSEFDDFSYAVEYIVVISNVGCYNLNSHFFSPDCAANVGLGFKQMMQLMNTVEGRKTISDTFVYELPLNRNVLVF